MIIFSYGEFHNKTSDFIVEALDGDKVNTINEFSNILARFSFKHLMNEIGRGHKRCYLWLCKWLARKNLDCKLAIYVNCFNEIQKNMIHDLGSRHSGVRNGSDVSSLDKLKSCYHHSLRDMCVHTDGAW